MTDEPSNAVSEVRRTVFEVWCHIHLLDDEVLAEMLGPAAVPGLATEDRRKLVGGWGAKGSEQVSMQRTYMELSGGPIDYRVVETLAVCGDRLALIRLRIRFADDSEHELLMLNMFTVDMQLEREVLFDVDDAEEALALLRTPRRKSRASGPECRGGPANGCRRVC